MKIKVLAVKKSASVNNDNGRLEYSIRFAPLNEQQVEIVRSKIVSGEQFLNSLELDYYHIRIVVTKEEFDEAEIPQIYDMTIE